MPPKRSTKKQNNGHKSSSKSPQAIGQLKRANSSKLDYIVNARDIMSLKFVHTAADLDSFDGFFSPVYVHQLFQNEKIIGYLDLQIRVFFSQPSLHCYIEIEYTEKLRGDDTTDIIKIFRKWIKAGFTQNKPQFIKKLDEEFIPFGEVQSQFIKPENYNSYYGNNNDTSDIEILSDNYKHRPSPRNSLRKSKSNTNTNNCEQKLESEDEYQSGHDGDDDDGDSVESMQLEQISPRNARLLRRKRRIDEMNSIKENESDTESDSEEIQPRKRRKIMHRESDNSHSHSSHNTDSDSDASDQKKDCIQSNDMDIFNNKNNKILNSKFYDYSSEIYEIRIGSFAHERMREFHLRLQFFVLLYIESSSFLDITDEIWEVMVLFRRLKGKYETLGYLTLYKFYAFPDKKRLRISQVIIFPPFQRKGLGFEALQHVYLMAKYRDFIEVNVEDPGEGFQKLRDTTDAYNAYLMKCYTKSDFKINNLTTYHRAKERVSQGKGKGESDLLVSYSPNTRKNKRNLSENRRPLFPFVTQHQKLSKDIYHKSVMNCHKTLKITPEQARIAYECLKWEYTNKLSNGNNGNNGNNLHSELYKLDVKRRLYSLLNLESIHSYEESGIFARLTEEFNSVIDRYDKIIRKRNDLLLSLSDWDETHEYPLWIKRKLNSLKDSNAKKSKGNTKNYNSNKKKAKNRKRRR